MKLCINCAHHHLLTYLAWNRPNEHGCDSEGLIDPVDGSPLYRKCATMRKENGTCGPDAKHFKQVPTE